MQRKKERGWTGTVFVCMALTGAALLTGFFLTGPGVQGLGAEEAKTQQMKQEAQHADMPAVKAPPVEHPMMKPARQYSDKGKCPNCGMNLNMWARTRYQFQLEGKEEETCSLHCVADRAVRAGAEPTDVKVGLYLEPEKMIPVDQAFYVIGSTAPGTMTMVSKLAFADRAAAEKFADEYGGVVTGFDRAYQQAAAQLDKDRAGIDAKRKKSGKIAEPTPADACTVCGMRPASYPSNRAQILTSENKTLHFCSGRCLVNFLAEPAKYGGAEVKPMFVWATVFPEAVFDYAGGLYYVVGSKAMGPMGPEPFAFRTRKQASDFTAKEGGTIVPFDKLKPDAAGH